MIGRVFRLKKYFVVWMGIHLSLLAHAQQPNSTDLKRGKVLFKYKGTRDPWKKWFLDGTRASITTSKKGMLFEAGQEFGNDTCNAVLWTKKDFTGNVLIEFDYTRTDTTTRNVNILYFHATGKGDNEYPEDIYLWRDKRTVPKMNHYFLNMNAYHISYAAFDAEKYSGDNDYIRLRRYDPALKKLAGSEILPDKFKTGMFKPFTTYHIEVGLLNNGIMMRVTNKTNPDLQLTCQWDAGSSVLSHGRVGVRHMNTRNALYKNIIVRQIN